MQLGLLILGFIMLVKGAAELVRSVSPKPEKPLKIKEI